MELDTYSFATAHDDDKHVTFKPRHSAFLSQDFIVLTVGVQNKREENSVQTQQYCTDPTILYRSNNTEQIQQCEPQLKILCRSNNMHLILNYHNANHMLKRFSYEYTRLLT